MWTNPNDFDKTTEEIAVHLERTNNKGLFIYVDAPFDNSMKRWIEKNGKDNANIQLELEKHKLEKEREHFKNDAESKKKCDERMHTLLMASDDTKKKAFEAWIISSKGRVEPSKSNSERAKK